MTQVVAPAAYAEMVKRCMDAYLLRDAGLTLAEVEVALAEGGRAQSRLPALEASAGQATLQLSED